MTVLRESSGEPLRPPARDRSFPATPPTAQLRRGGHQEVQRRRSQPARRADRLLRLLLAVPAAPRLRDRPRLRAAGQRERAGKRPSLHAQSVPGHRQPAAEQRPLAEGQRGRARDRPDRLAARGPRHHRRNSERLQPGLVHPPQAAPELPDMAAAGTRAARGVGRAVHRLDGGRRLRGRADGRCSSKCSAGF